MAMKSQFSLAIFFFFFLLALSSISAISTEEPEVEEPELKTCKHQCKQQLQYSESDKRICKQRCEGYHQMKKERERQIEEEARERKEQEMEEKGSRQHHHHSEEEEEEEEEDERDENPYVFEDEDFDTKFDTEDGRIWVLQKFTKKSKLLRGIENFRLSILEAKGHTFISPRHFDSEAVIFNVKGRAIIGLVTEDKTEKFNLERGDIMRIPAGTPVYMVNRDENERLFIANFHIPVSTPGNYEEFFGPGGQDPESVLTTFSWEVLEAALKTPRGTLKGLFDQQNRGSMFRISRQHVQSLAPKQSIWPFGGQFNAPFNLFSKRPSFSNEYGRLFEVGPNDERSGLKGLNLMLSLANITNGSMSTLMYNTHATKIALVIDGEGYFEMACPHLSSRSRSHSQSHSQEQMRSSPSYHKISERLKPGMVFVVPAGHPFVTIASKKNNLVIVCFEVNAKNNKKLTFAGKKNIVSALDRTAKEVAFNYPADKVDRIFERDEEFFFPGPGSFEDKEERGRADA